MPYLTITIERRCYASMFNRTAKWEQAKQDASNPETSPGRLRRLSREPRSEIVQAVARNPSTDVATLEQLALHTDSKVRADALSHPRISLKALERGVLGDQWSKNGVASNPNCPESLLRQVARSWGQGIDPCPYYDLGVGLLLRNPQCTLTVLAELLQFRVQAIKLAVAASACPYLPVAALLATDPNPEVRIWLAENSQMPHATLAPVLTFLSTDPVPDVRIKVALNPHTSTETRMILRSDSNTTVRDYADGIGVPFPWWAPQPSMTHKDPDHPALSSEEARTHVAWMLKELWTKHSWQGDATSMSSPESRKQWIEERLREYGERRAPGVKSLEQAVGTGMLSRDLILSNRDAWAWVTSGTHGRDNQDAIALLRAVLDLPEVSWEDVRRHCLEHATPSGIRVWAIMQQTGNATEYLLTPNPTVSERWDVRWGVFDHWFRWIQWSHRNDDTMTKDLGGFAPQFEAWFTRFRFLEPQPWLEGTLDDILTHLSGVAVAMRVITEQDAPNLNTF